MLVARALRRLGATLPLDSRYARRIEWHAGRLEVLVRKGRSAATVAAARRGSVDLDPLSDEEALVAERFEAPGGQMPLVLITQAGRSGGTLLLRLFDGHSAFLTVPHELGGMLPAASLPRDAREAFEMLTPNHLYRWHRKGVSIGWAGLGGPRQHRYEFRLPPALLWRLFAGQLATSPPSDDRDVLDAYFDAYFGAWIDGPGHDEGRRWWVGFEPGAIAKPARMERFDTNYPLGRVVSVVRDPWSWFVSIQRKKSQLRNPRVALRDWLRCVEAALVYREKRPERILLLAFDDLLLRTRLAMGAVAAFLHVPLEDAFLEPTLSGREADTNSSFGDVTAGVSAAPLVARRDRLDAADERVIGRIAGATWERVREVVAMEAPAA